MKLLVICLACVSLLSLCSGQVLPDGSDTFTVAARAGENFGKAQLLFVTGAGAGRPDGPGRNARSWISFDLSTLPAGTTPTQVLKATLLVYASRLHAGGTVEASESLASWQETTLNSDDAPATGAPIGKAAIEADASFVTVDVTRAVQDWLQNPESNFGLVLSADSGSPDLAVAFDSKENVLTGHWPRIEIALALPTAVESSTNVGDVESGTHVYANPGNYQFTVPAGVSFVHIEIWGAGGGGMSSAPAGGGSGAFIQQEYPVVAGQLLQITVGAGAAVNRSTNGSQEALGGSSSVGASVAGGGGTAYTQICTTPDCGQPVTITVNGVAYPPYPCAVGAACPTPGQGGVAHPSGPAIDAGDGAPAVGLTGVGAASSGAGAGGNGGSGATPGGNGMVILRW